MLPQYVRDHLNNKGKTVRDIHLYDSTVPVTQGRDTEINCIQQLCNAMFSMKASMAPKNRQAHIYISKVY